MMVWRINEWSVPSRAKSIQTIVRPVEMLRYCGQQATLLAALLNKPRASGVRQNIAAIVVFLNQPTLGQQEHRVMQSVLQPTRAGQPLISHALQAVVAKHQYEAIPAVF